jgi:thioredoxin-like negative regulator of GroEL
MSRRWQVILVLMGTLLWRLDGVAQPAPVTMPDDEAILSEAAAAKPRPMPRVPWLLDEPWNAVLDRAHSNDQPVLIDFTATWCGPCKLLDVMVFTEKSVIGELSEVVTFQVDIDKPEYQHLKESFAVEVVPTLVWCDKRGQEIDRFTGYVSSAQFLDIVRGWRGNRTIDRVLSERQGASPQDPAVLLDVARRQAERGNDRQADVLYRRLLNLRHEADPRTVARGMLGLAEIEHRFGREDQARHLARRVAELYTRPDASTAVAAYRGEGMMEAALFQESIGDTPGMLATFRTLAETDRSNVLALHGYARAAVAAGADLVPATRSALRAVVYSDNDPDVISTLAECYYWRGMNRKAIRWQNKAVAAAPHQQRYRQALEDYEAAQAADPYGMRGAPIRTQ